MVAIPQALSLLRAMRMYPFSPQAVDQLENYKKKTIIQINKLVYLYILL